MTTRTHSKAYLESLLQPPSSSGTIGSRRSSLTRSASGLGLATGTIEANHYKPTRSSGLAVEGSRELGEEDEERRIEKDRELDDQAAITSAASISSASEDDEYDPSRFLKIHTASTRQSLSSNNTHDNIQAILSILDDENLDDEERVDHVRTAISDRIAEIEGAPVVSI